MGGGLAFLLVVGRVSVSLRGPQAVLHTCEFPLADQGEFFTLQIFCKKAETTAFLLLSGTWNINVLLGN